MGGFLNRISFHFNLLTRSMFTMRSMLSLPFFPFLPLHFDRLTWPLAKAPFKRALPDADLGTNAYGGASPGFPCKKTHNNNNEGAVRCIMPALLHLLLNDIDIGVRGMQTW